MNLLRKPVEIIKENKKAFIAMNAFFYGLVLLGMIVTAFFPELQERAYADSEKQLSSGWLSAAAAAYENGNLLAAMGFTFVINTAVGAFLSMTLPSFIVPFIGFLMAIYRGFFWGVLFAPINPDIRTSLIPHYLTLLIEAQGYIVAMFAIYLHGRSFLFPKSIGLESRWSGYRHGLIQTAWMYVLVTTILLISAVYEAIDVILLIPLFE